MARLAAVLQRSGRELAFVNILVAVLALGLGDLEDRCFALRYVALVARDGYMAAFQRVFCGRMIPYRKRRWLETF